MVSWPKQVQVADKFAEEDANAASSKGRNTPQEEQAKNT